jgi:hypothetical protein
MNTRTSRSAWLCLAALACALLAPAARAQDSDPVPAPSDERPLAEQQFDAAMAAGAKPSAEPAPETSRSMNLLEMASPRVGGVFLYPIYAFSFVVVLFGIERALGLRRRKVIPRRLAGGIAWSWSWCVRPRGCTRTSARLTSRPRWRRFSG